jgi:anti-sigma factor RsiW
MNEQQMREQFQQWLPWHVNGTLDAGKRAWIEQYLKDHAEARAELRWHESLQTRIQEHAPEIAADQGLDKLMARIARQPRPAAPSLMERINGFFATFRLTPAYALAATVILAQAGVIGMLLLQHSKQDDRGELGAVRSLPAGQALSAPVLKVNFKPEATEREIRMLLVSVGGTVIDGPGQFGSYIVTVAPNKLEQAQQQLSQSRIVEAASVAHGLSPKE